MRFFTMKITPNVRTVALIIIGLSYLFMGAAIFSVIEKENETIERKRLFAEEDKIRAKYNISGRDFENLTRVILSLEPHKAAIQWEFAGSLYFAITVITTIGYGHSVPRTSGGKIFCMIYSVIGIPLCLVMFQATGERINNAAKYALKIIGRKLGLHFKEVSHASLVPVGILSCCLTVAIGCLAFHHFENWPFLDSLYYCVITLTTIGFGDFVALQSNRTLQYNTSYVAFSFVYIMIGLTVIGAFLNLVVLRLMVTTADEQNKAREEEEINNNNNNNSVEPDMNNQALPPVVNKSPHNFHKMDAVNINSRLHNSWRNKSWTSSNITGEFGRRKALSSVSDIYQDMKETQNVSDSSQYHVPNDERDTNQMPYSSIYHCETCIRTCPIKTVYKESLLCDCKACMLLKQLPSCILESHCDSNIHKQTEISKIDESIEDFNKSAEKTLEDNVATQATTKKTSKEKVVRRRSNEEKRFEGESSLKVCGDHSPVMSSLSLMSMESGTSCFNDDVDNALIRHLSIDSGYCGNEPKDRKMFFRDETSDPVKTVRMLQRPCLLNLGKAAVGNIQAGSFPVSLYSSQKDNQLSLPTNISTSVLFPSVTISRQAKLLTQDFILRRKASVQDPENLPSITVTPCSPVNSKSTKSLNGRLSFSSSCSETESHFTDATSAQEKIPTTKICANGKLIKEGNENNSNSILQTSSNVTKEAILLRLSNPKRNSEKDKPRNSGSSGVKLRRRKKARLARKWGSLHNFLEKIYGGKVEGEYQNDRRTQSFSGKLIPFHSSLYFHRFRSTYDMDKTHKRIFTDGDYLPKSTSFYKSTKIKKKKPKDSFLSNSSSMPNIIYFESNYRKNNNAHLLQNSTFVRRHNLSL